MSRALHWMQKEIWTTYSCQREEDDGLRDSSVWASYQTRWPDYVRFFKKSYNVPNIFVCVSDTIELFFVSRCMKEGTVAETGTHEQLMELKGEYAKLYNIQASAFAG